MGIVDKTMPIKFLKFADSLIPFLKYEFLTSQYNVVLTFKKRYMDVMNVRKTLKRHCVPAVLTSFLIITREPYSFI